MHESFIQRENRSSSQSAITDNKLMILMSAREHLLGRNLKGKKDVIANAETYFEAKFKSYYRKV